MTGKSNKRKRKDRSDTQRRLGAASATPSLRPPGRFRGWRGWLLRLSLSVLSPILFFGLLETGLRLGNYGYPTGFFLKVEAGGSYTTNHRYGWRFFPRTLARAPHPCVVSGKPAGLIRIFVLGSSAAMGTPDPAFSFGRILEVMLREEYPGTRFEVINAAMTAVNSHVVLAIARDCAAREPDLFVVYMGNNEVVGPFGPGTVFGQWSPSWRLIRASLWLRSMRTGQLTGSVVNSLRHADEKPDSWHGMEMFLDNPIAGDDPRLPAVYDNFRRNLTDICRLARGAGAGVVLSTVAVNLTDCPPFASLHRPDLSPADLSRWQSMYAAAAELQTKERWSEALEQFEVAASIDGRYAELQFRIAQCLLQAGRVAEAHERFELARDLDVLRFRADSHVNATLREVANELEAAGVRLADTGRMFAANDPNSQGIAPENRFHEHVHLTFEGNYLLARSILEQAREALPQLVALSRNGPIPSQQRCAELLALTAWDEYLIAENMVKMTSKAPFTNQLNHRLRQALASQRRDDLRARASTRDAMQTAWKTFETAIEHAPDDWTLHSHFGRLAMQAGRPDVAVKQFRIAVERLPWSPSTHVDLGGALAVQGQDDEAIAHFQKALDIDPDAEEAHYNLGIALAKRRQFDEAIRHYNRALEIDPEFAEAHNNLGAALASRGQTKEAVRHFQRTLEINPDHASARRNLELARQRGRDL